MSYTLNVKLLSSTAKVPERKTDGSAGYDLFSSCDVVVPKRGYSLVNTDVAIEIPLNHYGRVAPRSGLAVKNGIHVGAGVIDSDYRGSVGVLLFNHSENDFRVNIGDRIAQLIIEKIETPEIIVKEYLPETNRGENGYGSTGVN